MSLELMILTAEAMLVYFLVLWAHSLRHRFGPAHFYALIGAITAIMSWVTDAGVKIQIGQITFVVGSTVFYTSLLLGVFVVYVFDGPRSTRIAISTVAGVSVIVPLVATALYFQLNLADKATNIYVPLPSLRINSASVITTLVDLVFLAIAWEFLGKPSLRMHLWLRTFITLLGVMWLDVLLFTAGAFAGSPAYFSIMKGTLINRFIISIFSFPFLYGYLHYQSIKRGVEIENRPVLAIFKQVAEIKIELSQARQEIERRKEAEQDRDRVIRKLQKTLSEVKTLRGFLPICSNCKRIRDDKGYWNRLELYIQSHSEAEFSHSICPECAKVHYPDLKIYDE